MFQITRAMRIPTKKDASFDCQAGEEHEEEAVHLAQKDRVGDWFRKPSWMELDRRVLRLNKILDEQRSLLENLT